MIHETSVPELLLAEEEGSALLLVLCRSGYRVLALFDPPADRLGRRSCDFSDAALIGCTAAPQPDDLPADYMQIAMNEGSERAACDYVAGMTDRFAVDVFADLYIPQGWSKV